MSRSRPESFLSNRWDDRGNQQIDVGDHVNVYGLMDLKVIDGQMFETDFVTTLIDEEAFQGDGPGVSPQAFPLS